MNIKDTMGKMFFIMMSAFAELEVNLLSERTKKGLESARARGKKGGQLKISDEKVNMIQSLYHAKSHRGGRDRTHSRCLKNHSVSGC